MFLTISLEYQAGPCFEWSNAKPNNAAGLREKINPSIPGLCTVNKSRDSSKIADFLKILSRAHCYI